MKFRFVATCIAACMFSLSAANAASVTLKLGHIAEPSNPYGMGADHFAELVKNYSNGDIEVQVFPSSQLGNQRDLVEGLTLGTVEMTLTGTAVLGNFAPEVSVFDLPFLFRDTDHAYKALDTIGMDLCKKYVEPKGMITLAIWENGIRHMTNNKRPIKTPKDMEGLKVRVMEQPVYIELMKALKASPTPMAMSELYTALQKGVIDGQENPLSQIATKHFYEVQKYVSLTAHTYAPEVVLISKFAWDGLNDSQKEIISKAALETKDWQRQLCRDLEDKFAKTIVEGGAQINDDVDKQAFIDATKSVWEIYTKKFGNETVDAIVNVK
ncbi:DctP family TRAP transporter solute-binding subunit [Succinivibrio sp.]|jgi:tripartite ATP-independent transporter DctP family solute receptor|uniref:TRAP transporter substrate-binding protein n=1 Tax=Succinivibrio sp. TaxID=2053619 RepID=UPI0025CFFC54|nr:DctP family TRAP transporter solute-binding subunit [uncultured Succinivibrio sp.]